MKRANTGYGSGGDDLQCVAPDHDNQLGTLNGSGTSLTVPDGSTIESDPAPKDGIAIVTIPAIVVRVRVGNNAIATANDQAYIGAYTWPMPISAGDRVSFYGDGGTGVVSIGLSK